MASVQIVRAKRLAAWRGRPPREELRRNGYARAIHELIVLALHQRRQFDVEFDFLVRVILEAERSTARLRNHVRYKLFARRISEVIPDQRIAFDVDLRRELARLVARYEEVYVRR